jgi:type IX secretion system PorP/SprF family membrane protein
MGRVRTILLILILLVQCIFYAQADPDSARIILGYPVYSQYLHNGLMINPAYAGSRDALSAVLSYRMQWMGISDAPRIESISLHSPMKNDKVALGFRAQFMQYGVTRSQSIYAVYAYHIRMARGKISFGLKAGADLSNTDYTGLLGIVRPDPAFPDNDKSYIFPNAGAGIYYFSNRFFAGLSVPSFLFYKNTGNGNVQAYHAFSEYDLILSAGALLSFSPVFKFKPSVLLNYSLHDANHINQFDINGNFIFADIIWAGGSWRTTEQVAVGHLQFQINQQLMLGLSYDYPVGRMNSYSKGSSEFILRYEFGSRVSAANPRYF